MVVDDDGTIYICDTNNFCIRKITTDGMVSTVIGKPGVSGYQDGNPEIALFGSIWGMTIDKSGNIYISDRDNNVIRKLSIQ